MQSGRRSGDWWHREESTRGDLWAPSGGLHRWPLEDLGAGATAGGRVVRVDAEPGLHHQGALRRVVLALVIWRQRPVTVVIGGGLPLLASLLGRWKSLTGALAAGVEVALSLLGGAQVRRTAATEGLVGHHQALHFPGLGASLAGARTLGENPSNCIRLGLWPPAVMLDHRSLSPGSLSLGVLPGQGRAPGTHRTPGGDEPTILAVLALARPHGRGLGQVGAAAGGRDVELGSPFGHTDEISPLCAGATI